MFSTEELKAVIRQLSHSYLPDTDYVPVRAFIAKAEKEVKRREERKACNGRSS